MKKFLNISLLALIALSVMTTSCKNEVDEIFDEDAVLRLEDAKAEFSEILTSEGGKWQMEYFCSATEQGYVYVMTFNQDGSVVISGKNKWIGAMDGLSIGPAVYGSATSLWEVITDNGPVLSFNSYNKYFHLFADPENIPDETENDPDETGYGHEGDYEFNLMKYSNDTLYICGKKYGIDMIMTRIPSDTDDAVYMDEVVANADSFFNAKIPHVYINLPNGVRWIVEDGATSILSIYKEGEDKISTAESHNVIITHDGLSFMTPITLDGYTIQTFNRQADGSLLCRDDQQTTMTADELATVYSNTALSWRLDLTDIGGTYADFLTQLASELKSYNKSTLVYAQISYDETLTKNTLVFNIKKGSSKYNAVYYLNIVPVNDTQVKFTVEAEGDRTGEVYAEKCPCIRTFLNTLAANTYDLSAPSLLAPVHMKLAENGNSANYMIWNIQ